MHTMESCTIASRLKVAREFFNLFRSNDNSAPGSRVYRGRSVSGGPERDVVIRTPDQRLRVFVSSTLGELADERRSVRRAISALRLTPVMFESGARPHPPRELYRAYLGQSDIFIGLYWQRYGQVAAGMEFSGLEDEFERSRTLPRLLYVKAPAPDREPRLTDLLARVRREASYRTFRTASELGRLVQDDLATLLSERFAAARSLVSPPTPRTHSGRSLPAAAASLFGRERAIDEVAGLIERADVTLVTLTGPGGIGKTRLALAVGERLRDRFDAAFAFVPLAGVTQPEQVLAAIGRAVGAEFARTHSPLQAVIERLGDDRWLLILDNLEQVLDAARDIDELLARCPGVAILATSRRVLRLRAERAYPVPPLPLPPDPATVPLEELASSPAVALFVDRAGAARHGFALTPANATAVAELCRRLEGIPLAIELAAARTRLLSPDALLHRLARSLDALGTGTVDMPERQHTLRATVEWSVDLLEDAERSLIETVAVFADGWTVEAAAEVAGLDEDRTLALTEALADHSLISLDVADHGPRSRMLETIREFVAERLAARTDVAEIQRRHADYYRALAERGDRPLRSTAPGEWLARLEEEAGNLAGAVHWYLDHDRAPLPHLLRVLWPFWFLADHMPETRGWVDELLPSADSREPQARAELVWTAQVTALEVGDDRGALAARELLEPLLAEIQDPFLRAVSLLATAWSAPLVDDRDAALREALVALEEFRGQDEPLWTALTVGSVGSLEIAVGRDDEALNHVTEARDLAARLDNDWLAAWSLAMLATLDIKHGRLEEAEALLDEALALSAGSRNTTVVTICLEAFARLALAEGDAKQAALLVGAAEGLRRRRGLRPWPMLRQAEAALVAEIRQALAADPFDQAFAAGSRLTLREAVAIAAGSN
jgi:predicted ATPase